MSKVTCPICKGTGRANGDGGPLNMPCGVCLRTGKVDEKDVEYFRKVFGTPECEQTKLEI